MVQFKDYILPQLSSFWTEWRKKKLRITLPNGIKIWVYFITVALRDIY